MEKKQHIPMFKMMEMLLEKQETMAKEIVELKALVQVQAMIPSQEIIEQIQNNGSDILQGN